MRKIADRNHGHRLLFLVVSIIIKIRLRILKPWLRVELIRVMPLDEYLPLASIWLRKRAHWIKLLAQVLLAFLAYYWCLLAHGYFWISSIEKLAVLPKSRYQIWLGTSICILNLISLRNAQKCILSESIIYGCQSGIIKILFTDLYFTVCFCIFWFLNRVSIHNAGANLRLLLLCVTVKINFGSWLIRLKTIRLI